MTYKRSNGRMTQRHGNGQFRKTTLQDFGIPQSQMATGERRCKQCGHVWHPILIDGFCPDCDAQDSEPVEDAAKVPEAN